MNHKINQTEQPNKPTAFKTVWRCCAGLPKGPQIRAPDSIFRIDLQPLSVRVIPLFRVENTIA